MLAEGMSIYCLVSILYFSVLIYLFDLFIYAQLLFIYFFKCTIEILKKWINIYQITVIKTIIMNEQLFYVLFL